LFFGWVARALYLEEVNMRLALATLFFSGCTVVIANAQSQQPVFELASIKLLPPEQPGLMTRSALLLADLARKTAAKLESTT
jgi:hypothetical protein